jgi:hypothetical protein
MSIDVSMLRSSIKVRENHGSLTSANQGTLSSFRCLGWHDHGAGRSETVDADHSYCLQSGTIRTYFPPVPNQPIQAICLASQAIDRDNSGKYC